MGRWRDETRRLTRDAQEHLRHVSNKGMVMWEQVYLRRIIEVAATDGSYVVHVDELWPQNIKWLKDEGFMVLGNDEDGYDISWGQNYECE